MEKERELTPLEKERLKESIKLHEETYELVKKELELKKKLFEIADKNPQVIEPKYKYEEDKDYWDTYKELSKVLHQQELVGIEDQLSQLKRTIEEKKKYLYSQGGEEDGNE